MPIAPSKISILFLAILIMASYALVFASSPRYMLLDAMFGWSVSYGELQQMFLMRGDGGGSILRGKLELVESWCAVLLRGVLKQKSNVEDSDMKAKLKAVQRIVAEALRMVLPDGAADGEFVALKLVFTELRGCGLQSLQSAQQAQD